MNYATYLGLSVLVVVGLTYSAASTAVGVRGVHLSCAAGDVPQSSLESLDVWIYALPSDRSGEIDRLMTMLYLRGQLTAASS